MALQRRKTRLWPAVCTALSMGVITAAGNTRIEPVTITSRKSVDFLTETAEWELTGPKLLSPWRCEEDPQAGKASIRIHARVDLSDFDPETMQNPAACLGLEHKPPETFTWDGFDAVAFDLRLSVKGSRRALNHVEISLGRAGASWRAYVMTKPSDQWQRVQIPFRYFNRGGGKRMPAEGGINKIRVAVLEVAEDDGAEVDVRLDNFEVLATQPVPWTHRCEEGTARASLYLGAAEEMTLLPAGTDSLPVAVGLTTGRECRITPDMRLRFICHDLFRGAQHVVEMPCPGTVIPQAKTLTPVLLPLRGLTPGFYVATVDVLRDGESLLNGRVGVDDFYIRKPGERIEHALASWLAAETYLAQHREHGYIFLRVRPSLSHTLSPLDPSTYDRFLLAHARDGGFYVEDLHSSVVTLSYAAEMFRAAAETERALFAEGILKRLMAFMSGPMLAENGAIHQSGSLIGDYDAERFPYGACAMKPTRINSCSMSQFGYWMTCVARAALYFAGPGADMAYARSLIEPLDRAAAFMTNAFWIEGDEQRVLHNSYTLNVLREPRWHFLKRGPSGGLTENCCGTRSVGALAFYACARRVIVGDVPAGCLDALHDTAQWHGQRVESSGGWADPGSGHRPGYEVNMYMGESFVAYCLYNRLAGDTGRAEQARKWARLAYRFITDKATNRDGKRIELAWNQWSGSWYTWSFGEFLQHLGPDATLAGWVRDIEQRWRERGFRDAAHRPWYHRRRDDFTDIPPAPYFTTSKNTDFSAEPRYRSPDKGAIYFSWLAPLSIYEMRAMGYESRLLTPMSVEPGRAPDWQTLADQAAAPPRDSAASLVREGVIQVKPTAAALDEASAFTFAIMSDNKGDAPADNPAVECGLRQILALRPRFLIGLGDHVAGPSWKNTFPDYARANPFLARHFYPNIADGENVYYGKGQDDWGAGGKLLSALAFDKRPEVRLRENGCEYYARIAVGPYRVHLIQLHYPDNPKDPALALPADSRQYALSVLRRIPKKNGRDIVVVCAHTGDWLGVLDKESRDAILSKADLVLGATTHHFQRYSHGDDRALVLNTGALGHKHEAKGPYNGWVSVHVLDNPLSLLVQYQNAEQEGLNVMRTPHAFLKVVGGSIYPAVYAGDPDPAPGQTQETQGKVANEWPPWGAYNPLRLLRDRDSHAPDAACRFVVYGDSRRHEDVLEQYVHPRILAIDPMLTIQTGDSVSRGFGTGSRSTYWVTWEEATRELRARIPMFPVFGNHEWAGYGEGGWSRGGTREYELFYDLPRESGSELYYSFVHNNVTFVVLAIEWGAGLVPGNAQWRWLENTLAAAETPHVVVVSHKPIYTVGHYDPYEHPEVLTALYRKYGVKLHFAAHDHIYYRTVRDGITFVISAGAGATMSELRHTDRAIEGDVFFSGYGKENKENFFYVVSCRAHEDGIEGEAVAAKSGRVLDRFEAGRRER